MPPPPLTHHQILGLVAPFSHSGRRVDLAASDRLARRLHFQPVQHAADGETPALTETLQLDCPEGGHHRLTRLLAPDAGPPATLQAMGSDLARLLAEVDAVPRSRHFQAGPGWHIARSYTLVPTAHGGTPLASFSQGDLWLDGLQFSLRVMDVKNVAGDITLRPAPDERLDLPEDLLAVMGWNWVRLVPATEGWTSKLRLRGSGTARTQAAERALLQAAQHLSAVLAAPPARYHPVAHGALGGGAAPQHPQPDRPGPGGGRAAAAAHRRQRTVGRVDGAALCADCRAGAELHRAGTVALRDPAAAAPVARRAVAQRAGPHRLRPHAAHHRTQPRQACRW